MIPPEADAELIVAMKDVLDTYEQPLDQDFSMLCIDVRPVQLHKEIRKPLAAASREKFR